MKQSQVATHRVDGGTTEQEIAMWKHTARVYEQRYENMRLMVNVSVVVSTGTLLIAGLLSLLLLLR
jgi:hypothetical protein|nr:MAG TPA: hypothetical protein [Caudoviricetes sp.]